MHLSMSGMIGVNVEQGGDCVSIVIVLFILVTLVRDYLEGGGREQTPLSSG